MAKSVVRVAVYTMLIFMLFGGTVYGLDIVIMPIDYQGNNISADITARIDRYYRIIKFDEKSLSNPHAEVSHRVATQVAEYHRVDIVLYVLRDGIKKIGNSSIQAELWVYDSRQREDSNKHMALYASDAVDQYERLIKTISGRILELYPAGQDTADTQEFWELHAEIAAVKESLKKMQKKEKAPVEKPDKEFVLRVPFALGYWSYIDRSWAEFIQGTVEITTGIDMFPELQFPALFDMKNEASVGLRIGYRNGTTGAKEDVMMNAVLINPVIGYHLNFYTNNWACMRVGAFYEFDALEIEEYNGKQSYQQSLTGYSLSLDYSYRIHSRFLINLGFNLYGYFSGGSSLIASPYLGTVITVFRGKK